MKYNNKLLVYLSVFLKNVLKKEVYMTVYKKKVWLLVHSNKTVNILQNSKKIATI